MSAKNHENWLTKLRHLSHISKIQQTTVYSLQSMYDVHHDFYTDSCNKN